MTGNECQPDSCPECPSPQFSRIFSGSGVPCSFTFPSSPPTWLDEELYDLGIRYFNNNCLGICASNGEALVSGLCIPSFYRVLAFSGQTMKKRDALVRYRDTAIHVFGKWYNGKPWHQQSTTSGSFLAVNGMHRHVARKVENAANSFDLVVDTIFDEVGPQRDFQAELLAADLEEMKERFPPSQEYYQYLDSPIKFSQFDMFLVQLAFYAAVILYPTYYGCQSNPSTGREIEGFLHVWRVFGYYLGIEDPYNGPQFSVETTRNLCAEALEKIVRPCCLNMNRETIAMGQALFANPHNYYVFIYRNYSMLGLQLPRLWGSFTARQRLWFYLRDWLLRYLYPLPGVRQVLNWLTARVVQKLVSMAKKFE